MLNAQRLKDDFVKVLSNAWDPDAIWPGCKDSYKPNVSHPSYGQCLVGTLAAWTAHDGENGDFKIVPGILKGNNISKSGVWHFQLADMKSVKNIIPVDVTWDQAHNSIFTPATHSQNQDLYRTILEGSFYGDSSLIPRLDVILKNLDKQGYSVGVAAEEIVKRAYDSFKL